MHSMNRKSYKIAMRNDLRKGGGTSTPLLVHHVNKTSDRKSAK